jgi:hypothetical protein
VLYSQNRECASVFVNTTHWWLGRIIYLADIPIICNKLVHHFTLLLSLLHTLFSTADNYLHAADKLRLDRHAPLVPFSKREMVQAGKSHRRPMDPNGNYLSYVCFHICYSHPGTFIPAQRQKVHLRYFHRRENRVDKTSTVGPTVPQRRRLIYTIKPLIQDYCSQLSYSDKTVPYDNRTVTLSDHKGICQPNRASAIPEVVTE